MFTEQTVDNPLMPIGGKLPYFIEIRTSKLLDVLEGMFKNPEKNIRQKLNERLAKRNRPGFYGELNPHIHIAYVDQRDGHGSQHYWRVFFDDTSRAYIEQTTSVNALVLVSHEAADPPPVNSVEGMKEWGGCYFRSGAEIAIAKELDKRGILFFANARGRIGSEGSPVSGAETNGRMEVDFLVFHQGRCASLEVDGSHHQEQGQIARDYVRDRLLLRERIPTVRFSAQDCLNRTGDVVVELMSLI